MSETTIETDREQIWKLCLTDDHNDDEYYHSETNATTSMIEDFLVAYEGRKEASLILLHEKVKAIWKDKSLPFPDQYAGVKEYISEILARCGYLLDPIMMSD